MGVVHVGSSAAFAAGWCNYCDQYAMENRRLVRTPAQAAGLFEVRSVGGLGVPSHSAVRKTVVARILEPRRVGEGQGFDWLEKVERTVAATADER